GPPSYQREGETEEDLLAFLVEGVNLNDGQAIVGDIESLRKDPFYDDILHFKELPSMELYPEYGKLAASKFKSMKAKCKRFIICETEPPRLAYQERDGKLSTCITPDQ